jgi:hypothetical protein
MSSSSLIRRKPKTTTPSGVSEMQYRKAIAEVKANETRMKSERTIDAAALQSDMARKYNLGGVGRKINTTKRRTSSSSSSSIPSSTESIPSSSNIVSSSSSSSSPPIVCDCCQELNNISETVCLSCGYFLASMTIIPETLAQRRGLIEPTPQIPSVSAAEWESLERTLKSRKLDAFCPICMEAFRDGSEVLLSCSHIFHRACLTSFEKFMKNGEKNCPICRSPNYQKKITNLGSKEYEVVCAGLLQALWRGYKGRKEYRCNLKVFYRQGKGDGSLRKRFYQQELSIHSDRISKDVKSRTVAVDSVLRSFTYFFLLIFIYYFYLLLLFIIIIYYYYSSVDNTLLESRQLDLVFESMLLERAAQRNTYAIEEHDYSYLDLPPTVPDDTIDSVSSELNDKCIIQKQIIDEDEWIGILKLFFTYIFVIIIIFNL